MVAQYVSVRIVRPAVVAILAAIVVGVFIFAIGQLLLNVHDAHLTDELRRQELWIGVALTVGILSVAAFLNSRPEGALGPIDKEVAIGAKPMRGELALSPVGPVARHGAIGDRSDLTAGYTLYARNGALAHLNEVLTSVEDVGDQPRTLLFARGLHGAPEQLWIPIEAVSTIYPETQSAFLAIAGDEAEALGWHRPPASFARTERRTVPSLY
ncbi:hypothetical protein BH23CHL5_BH23CHL5_19340 [soil metagenome]